VQTGLKVNKGLGAKNSVVKAADTFYWFGHDGDFYVYDAGRPKVISDTYRADLNKMSNSEGLMGFDIRKENLIMWINWLDGRTYLYDYSKERWLEDNRWQNMCWESLPFASYMELRDPAGKINQYFGSRNYDGLVHEWSADHKDDNGQPIRVFRHLKVIPSPRHNKVVVHRLRFKKRGGVSNATVTEAKFTLRYRWDKGDWRTQNVLLGSLGDYTPHIDVRNLGMGRELELEISEMDAVDFILTDMLVTFEELNG
jgi:hypothetical protein